MFPIFTGKELLTGTQIGALIDGAGSDRYQSYQYAQGSGVHLAHALLHDLEGDDIYVSHGVSQGCGHDVASGFLVDESGNDQYLAESLSMGAGNANAVSVFIDVSGDDGYIATNTENTMGYSDFRRNYGMIGVFVDGGGDDLYSTKENNNKVLHKSTFGTFADLDVYALNKKHLDQINNALDRVVTLTDNVDSLFVQASAAHLRFQHNVEPSRKKIIEMGKLAIPYLASQLNTEHARERHALIDILSKMYDKDTLAVKGLIMDSVYSGNYKTLMLISEVAGKKKVEETLDRFVTLLGSEDWRIRAAAAEQIGLIGDSSYVVHLEPLLNDENSNVRGRTSYSIAQLGASDIKGIMTVALNDKSQLVKNGFIQGLMKSGKADMDFILSALDKDIPDIYKRTILKNITNISLDKDGFNDFKKKFRSLPPGQRKIVYMAIIDSDNEEWQDNLKSLLFKSERDKELQKLVTKYMQEKNIN